MRTNRSSDLIIVLALAFACAVNLAAHGKQLFGAGKADKSLTDYLAELDEKQANLKEEFTTLMEKFYHDPQKKAKSELMKSDEANGYKMREISNVFAVIEYVKYAVRRKANRATRELLGRKFNQKLEGSDLVLDSDLATLLVDRFELRSLVDAYNSTSLTWNELYTLMPPKKEAPKQMRHLIEDIFKQRSQFGKLAHEANEQSIKDMGKFCKKLGYKSSRVAGFIYLVLDRQIDEAMGCPNCSELFEPDEDSYGAYPMFADWSEVDEMAKTMVDPELLESIKLSRSETQSHVKDLTDYELEAVEESDIDDMQEDYVGWSLF